MKKRSLLRRLRIGVGLVILSLITFYFLDFAEILPNHLHFLAHLQLIPALLSGMFVIVLALVVLTLLFGRVYCSFICPMGVFQDCFNWFARKMNRRKRYGFRTERRWVRLGILAVVIVAWLSGMTFLAGLVEPYSAYGRMATNVFSPVYMALNNLLAWVGTSMGNYTFYYVDISIRATAAFVVSLLTLAIIAHFAFHWGRTYCNTICPVGTLLGYISKLSLFKLHINTDACNNCGLCGMKCKGYCIDTKNHKIDYSRCIECYDCLENCHQHAISYGLKKKAVAAAHQQEEPETECVSTDKMSPVNESRRRFLLTSVATAAAIPMVMTGQEDGFFQGNYIAYKRKAPLSPPGSISHDHLLAHCTSCHLCVSKCPSNVLKPAFLDYGLGGMLQPMMDFEKGFCNFDCTVCGDICPNGAIRPLTVEQKHKTQMGRVVFIEKNCIVPRDHTSCGACSEHCPTQAVAMVAYKDGLTIPKIDPEICVGCGGCEYVCPAKPYKAIYIEGNAVQQEAKAFKEEKKEDVKIDDFGF